MARRRLLTDEMWAKIGPLLPEMATGPKGGRPWRDNREVVEGILRILRTGAPWADLPQEYHSPSTCWRRLRLWEEQGVWLEVWRAFLAQLDEKASLDWQEAFLDVSFAPAKGGGEAVGATKRGKGTKWMVVVGGQGLPLGSQLASASPAEVTLAEATLDAIQAEAQPARVIADRAYDSDALRQALFARRVELICPHRSNRRRPRSQDSRKLRRYRRRWKIERTFAWLGNFRRLVIRYERHLLMYAAFFHLACCLILLRGL
jgi:transposase